MASRFFRQDISWEDYREASGLVPPPGIEAPEAAFNIAPSQFVPIIRMAPEGEYVPRGTVQLAPAMWGLIPSWWNKPLSEKKFSTHMAKCEELEFSNTFRGPFRHHRCLIPASGYYAWVGPQGHRKPYAVGLTERRWFCFAGLWNRAMIDGSEIDTFTILSTRPNRLVSDLSSRMPVILKASDHARWMDSDNRKVSDLYTPYPGAEMEIWPVSPAVGNVYNQGEDLIRRA
ncbi:MAG: SOS response-associated peptidase [Alphaproteobacteria bacterium]|nr:DUF159 family protein [Hyphomonas sp.]MBR9808159.1 SOS response-associated peptidase [Alphaproteobacteria bacterium]